MEDEIGIVGGRTSLMCATLFLRGAFSKEVRGREGERGARNAGSAGEGHRDEGDKRERKIGPGPLKTSADLTESRAFPVTAQFREEQRDLLALPCGKRQKKRNWSVGGRRGRGGVGGSHGRRQV